MYSDIIGLRHGSNVYVGKPLMIIKTRSFEGVTGCHRKAGVVYPKGIKAAANPTYAAVIRFFEAGEIALRRTHCDEKFHCRSSGDPILGKP